MSSILILGCGFTGRRVAEILLRKGRSVIGTARHVESLAGLANAGLEAFEFDALSAFGL